MKKILILFVAVFAFCSNCYSQSIELTKVTSDYQTVLDINVAMFDFTDKELNFETEGMCFIKYEDFKSAGNFLILRYKLNEFANGREIVKKFEDVTIYKSNNGSYIISDKYDDRIVTLIKNNNKYAFCINNKMMLISD